MYIKVYAKGHTFNATISLIGRLSRKGKKLRLDEHHRVPEASLNLLIEGDRFKDHVKPGNEVIPNNLKNHLAHFLAFAPRCGLLESVFSVT